MFLHWTPVPVKRENSHHSRDREVTRVFQSNGRDQANEKTGLFTSGVLRDKNKARSIKRQKQGKLTVSFSFEIKLFFFFSFWPHHTACRILVA